MNSYAAAWRAATNIPPGKVATYADIARAIGRPRSWRLVGRAMSQNRDRTVPCHRVVRSDGRVGGFGFPGGRAEKIRRLAAEGVAATEDRINLARYRVAHPSVLRPRS